MAPDPYADEARTPLNWWPRAFPKFRTGGLPSRARAPAAARGSAPPSKSTLDAIAAEGVKALLLQPIGFLCDHVEILYDVDILFRDMRPRSASGWSGRSR